jgi:hypothetical protein
MAQCPTWVGNPDHSGRHFTSDNLPLSEVISLPVRDYSRTIAQLRHAFLFGAMSTAEDHIVLFNPVADDLRATMRASRCQRLDRTFEAIKNVILAV